MNDTPNRGAALVLTMLAVFFLASLGASLALVTNTELRIAASYSEAMELGYVAEAALEAILQELSASADWNALVAGTALSVFADGSPGGRRTLADGSMIDLDDLTRQVVATNPMCRLFGFGPVQRLQPAEEIDVDGYVVVWIGDDPEENPEILVLRAEAFGMSGLRRMLEARVRRDAAGSVQVVAWNDAR
jgi:hypothetical protein